jgi:hypothetical protein
MKTFFPFGKATSVLPCTPIGTALYTHLAITKLDTAQIQITTPKLTVMNSVGIRTSRATPIQKREKNSAVTSDRVRVPRTNERKRARGVKERRSWAVRKVCIWVRTSCMEEDSQNFQSLKLNEGKFREH